MPVLGNSSRVSSISRSVVSRVEVTDGELSEVITQQHNGVRAVDGFGADGPHDLRQGTFPAWESQCGPARGAWATVARVRRREQRADRERARERHARRRRVPWPDHPTGSGSVVASSVPPPSGLSISAPASCGSRLSGAAHAATRAGSRGPRRRCGPQRGGRARSRHALSRRRPSGRVCAGRPSSWHSDVRSSGDQSGRSRYRGHALRRFAEPVRLRRMAPQQPLVPGKGEKATAACVVSRGAPF
jgi:hypothetical protein